MFMPTKSHGSFRTLLTFKAVQIICLDENQKEIDGSYASGFITQEGNDKYLYTCWHVVTGLDIYNLKVGNSLPNIKYLKLKLQASEKIDEACERIGGYSFITIPLYDFNTSPNKPKWIQDKEDVPKIDLNAINIRVPKLHDVVKIELPSDIYLSEVQLIKSNEYFRQSVLIGDKLHIVGFPFKYSAGGTDKPVPIVLTRYVAATEVFERLGQVLLDGTGSSGMSGGPVFIEKDSEIFLVGLYTGLIYPDYLINKSDKNSALGTFCPLSWWWNYPDTFLPNSMGQV